MKNVIRLLFALILILSNAMCAFIAYTYASLSYSAVYEGASAPASLAFLWAIPFLFVIALCIMIIFILR